MFSLPFYLLLLAVGLCALGLVDWRQFLDGPEEEPVEDKE